MERWAGKVALVTGASAGIGAATAILLANKGMKVVGIARRVEKVEALKKKVSGPGELHGFHADIGNEADIQATFDFIKKKFGAIHVLVNNAGILRPGKLGDQELKFIREVFDVNVIGLTSCTQKALKLMKDSGVDDGHIIHINSIAGHSVVVCAPEPITSAYPATKFAVTALTEILRQELVASKSKIRVTSISPGYVDTEIFEAGLNSVGTTKGDADAPAISDWAALRSEDIADAIVYALAAPPHVQIYELTIKPVGEKF